VLAAVTEILRKHHGLDIDDEPGYNITLIKEESLTLAAFTRNDSFFHVRLKKSGALPGEYENFCNAWQLFPRHAPEPLGRHFKDDWEVLVVRGVRHRPVSVGSIAADKPVLVPELVAFFEAASIGAKVAPPVASHQAYLRQLRERTTDPICAAILQEWIATERLPDLPHIGQHGDFVLNNLGLTGSGMAVFDWEDFGRIAFPGLDLCTMLASDMNLNAHRLRAMIAGNDPLPVAYARLLDMSCPALGLTPGLFRQLMPLYLVIFADLKRDYGEAVFQVFTKLVHDVQG
jgi:hypothetical protein